MKQPVIAIIGAGSVGTTTAYALLLRTIPAKIVMVDVNASKCDGEVKDLKDSVAISKTSAIVSGSLQEAGQADIIIITAGVPQKPGQTRPEILNTNYQIIGSIIHDMKPLKKTSIIIMVTNPVDVLTRYAQEISGLPYHQVFGAGTFLDTNRLRGFLGEYVAVNPNSIDAYVVGEHGDNQVVAWSTALIGGMPLRSLDISEKILDEIAIKTKNKAYDVIASKGYTSFGVAAGLVTYCENIVADLKQVIPVSCFLEELGVYASMPVVLGIQGIEKILRLPLNKQEQTKLEKSASILDQQYAEIKK